MSNTRDTGFLRNLISYDASGNIVLPANLTVTGSLLTSGGATYATQSYVTTQISNLVNAAPGALDTLNELAAALGNDANFSTTVTNSIATKLSLTGGTLTGALSGTSATFSSTVQAAFLAVTQSGGQIGSFNSTNANGGYLTWQTSGTTIADIGTAQQIFGSGGNDTFGINARGVRSLIFGTNNTARFTIASSGAATFSSSVKIGKFTYTDFTYRTLYIGARAYDNTYSIINMNPYQGNYNYGFDIGTYDDGTAGNQYFWIGDNRNTERLRITSSGNVLVGASTTTGFGGVKLFVKQSTNADYEGLVVQSVANSDSITISHTGTLGRIATTYGSGGTGTFTDLALATSGSDRLYITTAGHVGINTTSPNSLPSGGGGIFTVYQSSAASLWLGGNVLSLDGQGTNRDMTLYFRYSSSANFQTDSYYRFLINASVAMTITSNGNVGIGTSSPNSRLDLGGGYGANGEKFFIYNDNTSSALAGTKVGFYMDRFGLSNNSTYVFPTSTANPGSYIISSKDTSNTTLVARVIVLGESGNVGIGTTTPGYKLDVSGPAKIGNSIYNLAHIPEQGNNNSYMHIKTNLYMGGAGNTMYIMGGFRFKGYQYNSNGWGEGTVAFHNWSGAFYNITVQNTGFAGFVRSPYVSADGYAVFVIANEYYTGVIIDYFQTVYNFRYPAVTAYTTSNSLTGAY